MREPIIESIVKSIESVRPDLDVLQYHFDRLQTENTTLRAALVRWEACRKDIQERIAFIETYQHERDPSNFNSGWSSAESGACCKRCVMTKEHLTGRADALKILVGCRNPFQLPEVCQCHIPFRMVAAKVKLHLLQELLQRMNVTRARGQEGR